MKFIKKPVEVEAQEVRIGTIMQVKEWCNGEIATEFSTLNKDKTDILLGIKIKTLEGEMLAKIGDWIIKGVKGEFYPCKPDIFEATYEKI